MTRLPLVLLAASLPLLVSCSDASPRAPLAPDAPSIAKSARNTRPFSGRCDALSWYAASRPGDPEGSLRQHITSVCQLQHLGLTTGVADELVVFTGPSSAVVSNSTVYTAANGDQLYSTWSGTAVIGADGGVVFSGPVTYSGGTGRFAAASGSSVLNGSASVAGLPPHTGQFTFDGTLSY